MPWTCRSARRLLIRSRIPSAETGRLAQTMTRRIWLPRCFDCYGFFCGCDGLNAGSFDCLDVDCALAYDTKVGAGAEGEQSRRMGRPFDGCESGGLLDPILAYWSLHG